MGSPSMNLVQAQVEAGGAALSLDAAGGAIRLALPNGKAASYAGRNVILGLRPEAITDTAGADRGSRHIQEAQCHVEVVEPTGSDTYVVTRLVGKEVTARMRADAQARAGQAAPFTFNREKAVLFDPETQKRIG